MQKYCISLYPTQDRLNGFLAEAKRFGLENYMVYFGLHSRMLPRVESRADVVLPAILLTLNHYALWNMIAMRPTREFYMIFEDDAVFNVNKALIEQMMGRVPAKAEFVSWGTSRPEGWTDEQIKLTKFYPTKTFPCTHAYMVTPQCARKMVSIFNEVDICDSIDLVLNRHIYPKIDVFLANYPLIGQKTVAFTLPVDKRGVVMETLLK